MSKSNMDFAAASQRSNRNAPHSFYLNIIKSLSALLFGVVVPGIITFNVITSLSNLDDSINSKVELDEIAQVYLSVRDNLEQQNQYALIAYMFSAATNQNTLMNKQIMKTVVIHIGFAVLSFGVLFIILGINQGAITASGQIADSTSIDVKSGSTGAGVILIGAAMVTISAVDKNEFTGVALPNFQPSQQTITTEVSSSVNDLVSPRAGTYHIFNGGTNPLTNSGGHNKHVRPEFNIPAKTDSKKDTQ